MSGMVTLSRSAYQLSRPSQPTEISEKMNEPRGMSGWMAPQVPMRRTVSVLCSGLTSRVVKSTLARASSSVMTMSMLSVPMPVDSRVILFPLYLPVMTTNSRDSWRNSLSWRYSAAMSTRPGSPKTMTLSASSSGLRWIWNAEPSPLMINSDSGILIFSSFSVRIPKLGIYYRISSSLPLYFSYLRSASSVPMANSLSAFSGKLRLSEA